jgi:hypothetical protein
VLLARFAIIDAALSRSPFHSCDGASLSPRKRPAERAQNLKTYDAPQLPLAPALVPAIAAFVLAQ